jgi:hypothetical protein
MAILLISQEFSFEFKESAERMGKSTTFSRCILCDKEVSFLMSAQRNLDGSASRMFVEARVENEAVSFQMSVPRARNLDGNK